MGRRTVTQFANQIKRVFSPKLVNDLGRRAAFCYRERLITPCRLMPSLLEDQAMGRIETLADIHRKFNALFGATDVFRVPACGPGRGLVRALRERVKYLVGNVARSRPKRDRRKGRLQSGLEPAS